jgi:hypothetical protein
VGWSLIGNSFTIAEAYREEVSPSIAYNSQRGEYLVVWHNDRPNFADIQAQRLDTNGNPIGGPFFIAVGQDAKRQFPDVIHNSLHDQYLVVWEGYDPISTKNMISARRVDESGVVLDSTDINLSGPVNIVTPSEHSVSYAFSSDRYLVVWAETIHPGGPNVAVNGQVMKVDGSLDGGPFVITLGPEPRYASDVANNRHANRYLVIW